MKISVAKAYVRYLEELGVSTVFCIPGGAIYPLLDVLGGSKISLITLAHEQSLVHAAEGYSFANGNPSVVLVTSGPGVTNTITGLLDASFDHRQVVIIAGQVNSQYVGKNAFQEVNIRSTLKTICDVSEVEDPLTALDQLRVAFESTSSAPYRPSLVSVPSDMWREHVEYSHNPPTVAGIQHDKEVDKLATFRTMLEKSERPLLLLGQGANGPEISNDLLEFASNNQIPIVSTLHGLGSVPMNYSNWLGMVGEYGTRKGNYAVENCDLLIILGASLNERVVGYGKPFAPNADLVHVDLDKSVFEKWVRTKLKICLSVEKFISEVKIQVLSGRKEKGGCSRWLEELSSKSGIVEEKQYNVSEDDELVPLRIFEEINSALGVDDLVVTDCGLHQMWAAQLLRLRRPRQFLTTGGSGTMGFALSAAIGASLAERGRVVWCLIGDGGLSASLFELAMLKEYRCNVKVILFNNSSYGMVRQAQSNFFRRLTLAKLHRRWKFKEIARAFGVPAVEVVNHTGLAREVKKCSREGPLLLELTISERLTAFPFEDGRGYKNAK